MGKPNPKNFNWARMQGSGKPYQPSTTNSVAHKRVKSYVHTRKQISSEFPTLHFFCDTCERHWEGCCITDYVLECKNPPLCAFEKELNDA